MKIPFNQQQTQAFLYGNRPFPSKRSQPNNDKDTSNVQKTNLENGHRFIY